MYLFCFLSSVQTFSNFRKHQHQLNFHCKFLPFRASSSSQCLDFGVVVMELSNMDIDMTQQASADPLAFARSYQLEALDMAIKKNTIVFLETGSGKTLIAIMLLRSYAYLLRKPSPYVAVFLVPKVVLVTQQAEAIKMHTDLNVGMYWGDMGVDFWGAATWREQISKHEVLVMTPQILLDGLRHSFFKLNMVKVLIFDECHHAKGNSPYASILTEFYHRQKNSGISNLPRIFGMTASLINSKGSNSEVGYRDEIAKLENLMNSKVYTCVSESVLAQYIPSSTLKFKFYQHIEIPYAVYGHLEEKLKSLKAKHKGVLQNLDLSVAKTESISKKVSQIHSTFLYCLEQLGVWLAFKAAESLSGCESDYFACGQLDVFGEQIITNFSLDAVKLFSTYIPSGLEWSIGHNVNSDVDAGLLTTKVRCLVDSLLEYRALADIRCIIFVERVITTIVLKDLLSELLPRHNDWKTKYIAGNSSRLQSQSRKKQNEIVEEFRRGQVNIIVATSILEEGLDVQSCNLVVRFDPSATVCSFIQSRGRARMQNADYLLIVKTGDNTTLSRLKGYLDSGNMMRMESLRLASLDCLPMESNMDDEVFYQVESTEAIVTLSSSVGLIYFYCSRLPSDCYFKPAPRCVFDKEMETFTLYLPKSCPLEEGVCVQGNIKNIKQIACLKACKQLHAIGALTDNLVPDIVVEEADVEKFGNELYNDEHPIYIPSEVVDQCLQETNTLYFCYLIELKRKFEYDIPVQDIVLAVRTELESDIENFNFDMEVDRGRLSVSLKYVGNIQLQPSTALACRRFQATLFRVLMEHSVNNLTEVLNNIQWDNNLEIDYLLLPSISSSKRLSSTSSRKRWIDWTSIASMMPSNNNVLKDHMHCSVKGHACAVKTKNGVLCTCMIQNSLAYTPHNGYIYCITGILKHLNANSHLNLKDGGVITYKQYYKTRHGIQLYSDQDSLLNGRHLFHVKNYLNGCRQQKEKEPSNVSVELPPELCHVIMSPISLSTIYTFTFVPSIMHQLQSFLLAMNLKRMLLQNIVIPTAKVLEAITTKKCQESFHLESLETLGDSFLKYAASQQLFKTYQNNHEGLLSVKKDKIISNAALCKLGCDRKIPGFIRTEPFDPKRWIIPRDNYQSYELNEELLPNGKKIYFIGRKKVKSKTVADVVEALIGAFLSTGGESAGLLFLNWIGIEVDFVYVPNERPFQVHAEKLVNVRHLESLLNYKFRDRSLLVEALTHGSYMLPEIPRCYQRLEFLGDAVLDYLITMHLFKKYPGLSPGFLTDMRSASVNNDCYARSSVKHELHKHILQASHELHKQITSTVNSFKNLCLGSTFGWESETSFPKVLGDVMESLAGAIFVDSGFSKEVVFQSIRPLLEPLITPETMKFHPVRELNEICQKEHFEMKKPLVSQINGRPSVTIEVEANGAVFNHTASASDKKTAKKVACKEVLKALKEHWGGSLSAVKSCM
uniref:Dicer-like 2 protein n=1 Tax=Dimocarpus longan TaxID=128017 RepID=A0A2H5BXW1_9ROSI|nr:dicer-like 2 protein [Dimocarpus longan]